MNDPESPSNAAPPIVTVVTVVRNGEQLIEQTIRSVLEQTYRNIEYIIIDGGSTDGTCDIIRKYQDRVAFWSSEPDRGIYDAMNKGIDRASGSWINFMNAGDRFFQPDTVERVVDACSENSDLIYGHCELVYDDGFSMLWRAGNPGDLWKGMVFRHQSLFTRSSICRKYRFDLAYRIGADFDFVYRCYRGGLQFALVDLTIASVGVGGLSDIHIIPALWDNYRSVSRQGHSMRVGLYYRSKVLMAYVTGFIKKFIPGAIVQRARAFKLRLIS